MRATPLLFLLLACAGEDEPGRSVIRHGSSRDALPDSTPADARVVDPADAAPIPDAVSPDAGADRRRIWVLDHGEPWDEGIRAALEPPHTPAGELWAELPGADRVVVWRGPADGEPGAAGVLYVASGAPSDVRADIAWLAAHHLDRPDATRVSGRPLLLVEAGELWGAVVEALAAVPAQPYLVAVVDPLDRAVLPPVADALLPGTGYGHALGGDAPEGDASDAAHLARWKEAASRGGQRWIPRAAPPANPRLDHPAAAVGDPRDGRSLRRSLVLARRAGEPGGPVLVDGAGAWRSDRQLDPVRGAPTEAPEGLTTGVRYMAYGTSRAASVRDLLAAPDGSTPEVLGSTPELLVLFQSPGVRVERLEADATGVHLALRDEGRVGRLEVLLEARAYRLPPAASLRYTRVGPVHLELVFADGERLHDRVPLPTGRGVRVPLAAFAGRRVEELTLVYGGGVTEARASVRDMAIIH